MKAYKQDFTAIATLLAGAPERVVHLTPGAITKDAMQTAFAACANTHEAASIRRCWSNWNTLCDFLYSGELITGNPMPLVGRPKVAKTLPKGLGTDTISALLKVIDDDRGSGRRSD
jgi:site-specific recombinase XerC